MFIFQAYISRGKLAVSFGEGSKKTSNLPKHQIHIILCFFQQAPLHINHGVNFFPVPDCPWGLNQCCNFGALRLAHWCLVLFEGQNSIVEMLSRWNKHGLGLVGLFFWGGWGGLECLVYIVFTCIPLWKGRWRTSHVLLYHGALQIATLRCNICNKIPVNLVEFFAPKVGSQYFFKATIRTWVVVSDIFFFTPKIGEMIQFD